MKSSRSSVVWVAIVGLLSGLVTVGPTFAATLPVAPVATQINGLVWLDADADGVNDVTENGLSGASVSLFDAANAQVGATIVTPATGLYSFTALNVAAGPFRVSVSLPALYIVTVGGADNDVVPVGGSPAVGEAVNVAAGTQVNAAARPAWVTTLGRVGAPGYLSGSAPFDAVCPVPGSDCSDSDTVVRSQDSVTFNWSVTASNTAAGTWPADLSNVIFEQTLVPTSDAFLAPVSLPAECTGTPPASRVTVNADRSVTLICNLGQFATGSAKLIAVKVPVTGTNGAQFTSTARTYASNTAVTGGNATTLPTTTMRAVPSPFLADTFTVTATFAYDLVTLISPYSGTGTAGVMFFDADNNSATPAVRGVSFIAEVGVLSRTMSNEPIALPLNVQLDLFATTGGQTAPFSGSPIQWYTQQSTCGTFGGNLPLTGGNGPNTPGSCGLTRTNPGDASSAYTMALTSMNFTGPFPQNFNSTVIPLPANTYFVGTFKVPVFVPWTEVDRLDGVIGNDLAGANSFLAARISDFDPVGVSGVTNNNGSGVKEPGYCSSSVNPYSVADVTSAAHCQDAYGFVTQSTFPGLSRNYDNIQVPNTLPGLTTGGAFFKALYDIGPSWNGGNPGISFFPTPNRRISAQFNWSSNDGSGLVAANKIYTVSLETVLSGEVPVYNPRVCDVFDNQTQRLMPATSAYPTAPANAWAWVSSIVNSPADPNNTAGDYQFQFGHFDLTGVDQVTGPMNPNGRYPGTWSAVQTAANNCSTTAPPGGWQSDPNLVTGGGVTGVDAVNAVLITRVNPTTRFMTDATYSGLARTRFQFLLQARDTYNGGPYAGQTIATGTVLPDLASQTVSREFGVADFVVPASYTPSPTGDTVEMNATTTGDRVTIARAYVAIKARTVTVTGIGTAPAAIDTNGTGTLGLPVVWQVLPQLVSLTGQPESASNVVMQFDVPAGLTYDPSCSTVVGGVPPAQVLLNTPSAGLTRLQWTVPTLASSALGTYLYPDYFVCTQSSNLAASPSTYSTTVTTLPNTQGAINSSSDIHSVTLTGGAQLDISKSVAATLSRHNDSQVYTLGARNRSASFAFNGVQFIEVLPYSGDGASGVGATRTPASSYAGTATLTGPPTAVWPNVAGSPAAPVTYLYTADAPATVSQDPNVMSNTWCSYSAGVFTLVAGVGACPASFANVSAFRALLGDPLEINSSTKSALAISFTLATDGNTAGDVYANRVVASVNEITDPVTGLLVPLLSNQTTVRVLGFSVGDLLFADRNADGKFGVGVDALAPANVPVQLWEAGPDGVVGGGDDTLMLSTVTDANGRYLFPLVEAYWNNVVTQAPRVFVKIPAGQFAPGGLLAGWSVTSPQGAEDENQDLSQDGVAGAGGVTVGGVVTSVHTLSYTTVGTFFLGNEPLNDNAFSLPMQSGVGDGFTNLTLDVGLLAPSAISIEKEVCTLANGSCDVNAAIGAGGWSVDGVPGVGPASEFVTVAVGSDVLWRITVANIGLQPLLDVVVTDALVAACGRDSGSLPGLVSLAVATSVSWTCTTDDIVTAILPNTATVDAQDAAGAALSASDTAGVQLTPLLSITKDVAGAPIANGDGTFTVAYDIVVANSGGPGTYDLNDTFNFGAGVTVVAGSVGVSNTVPGTIVTRAAWNGSTDTLIVDDAAIATGASHTYRVVVDVSVPLTVTTQARNCSLDQGETGTGTLNGATATYSGGTLSDDACAPLRQVAIDKSVVSSVANGDGTYTVTYDVTVSNPSTVTARYDLDDTLQLGTGITVVPGSVSVTNTAPGTIVTNPAWDGVAVVRVVTDQLIAPGTADVYRVVIDVDVPFETLTTAGDCSLSQGESGTGTTNSATVTMNGQEQSDEDCAPVPSVTIDKSLVGAPVANGDGTYTATYEITVANDSGSGTVYDLSDTFQFGAGITVLPGSVAVSNTAPGTIVTNSGFDGAADTVIVSDVAIGVGVSHTYQVSVDVTVPLDLDASAADCSLAQGETGTGLLNSATVTVNGRTGSDDACAEVAVLTIDKRVVDSQVNGDGTFTITYDIDVVNVGSVTATYDLVDRLTFGAGVTVPSATVSNTVPGDLGVNSGWDGLDFVRVVDGVSIGGDTTHTYRVVVIAAVPLTVVSSARDCTVDEGETGSGFLNTATLSLNGNRLGDDACAGIPQVAIDKALIGAPAPNGDGTYTIQYEITVSNTSTLDADYDLDDELRFGAGIEVVSATITATTPDDIVVDPGWDGVVVTRIVTDRPIAAGVTEVYVIEVVATADISVTSSAGDCTVDIGEAGTGFLNSASISFNGQTGTDDACAPAPSLSIVKNVVGSPTRRSDDTYSVVYEIIVSNVGEVDATYDLDDDLQYGAGITVTSASVTNVTPGGILTNPGWNGQSVRRVVGDQAIPAGSVHTYSVTVITGPVASTVSSLARDCEATMAEAGTGFLNSATLASNGSTTTDTACAEVPSTPPPSVRPSLPRTGTEVLRILFAATVMLLLGVVALTARRRRYAH